MPYIMIIVINVIREAMLIMHNALASGGRWESTNNALGVKLSLVIVLVSQYYYY